MLRPGSLALLLLLSCGGKSDGADGGGETGAGGGGMDGGGTGGAMTAADASQGGAPGDAARAADAAPADGPRPTGDGAAGDVGTPGGPMGTQPLGSACANTGNCSQATGTAVCCVNTCTLADACPTDPGYLPCTKKADCDRYGGGKVCCQTAAMTFCTKQSACAGTILP
jgi:hypothetical protein